MKRGDIWTVAGGKHYAGKARPVVIVQDDSFDATGFHHDLRVHDGRDECTALPAPRYAE